jgi:hypothetical protein
MSGSITQHLLGADLIEYKAFLVGNDPVLPEDFNCSLDTNKGVQIIGCGVLKNLMIAAKIYASNNGLKTFPQITIIDNSRNVIEVWKALKNYYSTYSNSFDIDEFLIEQASDHYRNLDGCSSLPPKYEGDDSLAFEPQGASDFIEKVFHVLAGLSI